MSYPSAVPTSGAAATTRPNLATGAITSSTSAISSYVAPAASARSALHSKQTAGDPMATETLLTRCGPGIQYRCASRTKPEGLPALRRTFVDHRQPAQSLLEPRRL